MSTTKSPVPQLLYHNLLVPVYPGNTPDNVLTIRFPTPVRVESLRIAPEGVETLTGIGSTYPSNFSARILFNISPSNPVNALWSTSIAFDGSSGWEQDYQIGMPKGISTRMMVLTGGFDRLSLSIYGYPAESAPTANILEGEEQGGLTQSSGSRLGESEREDWGWVSAWAGGVEGLLALLDEEVSKEASDRAISCLELLGETCEGPAMMAQLLNHPIALPYLLLLPSYPPQPLLHRLYSDTAYALHLNLRHYLPPLHPLRSLVHGSEEARRVAAWGVLPHEGGLRMLEELGTGDLTLEDRSSGLSRMARLVEVLEQWKGQDEDFERGLDLLLAGIGGKWSSSLARRIPPLVVISNVRGSDRQLDIPIQFNREVSTALLNTASHIEGKTTLPITSKLVSRYLPNLADSEPIVLAFQTPSLPNPPLHQSTTSNGREVYRFYQALHSPPNALVHSLTPTQVLETIAPELLLSLSSAREPMFGLSSSKADGGQEASASAFAGKVYSSHEFRTRPTAGTSLAVSGAYSADIGGGSAAGSARLESRPASRHVDDYLLVAR